ncbi:ribosome recycling factor [Phocaeicola coprophilus]|jgi:ribosome recycling factor|uniref:Ribosome recycling factor n=1 Tax=Phocaeicola coprophilus TaxID=387090 RepID=A0A413T3L0_9BACT|nr:ribosome recycling factor [Phocaeicola coprophilus]RHA78032.1 ribosome recycling factor [Phocaeicola coprophilus]
MRITVYKLLQEAQQKMNGYAVYMNYQFMHFGVKAEPAALLSVEVEVGGERMNLEDVADVAIPQDDQFALIPKEQDFLFDICKAVAQAHPDYKIGQKSINEEEEDSLDGEEDRYVLCTMPEVNDDRHDVGMNYVKAIYEEMTAKIDTTHAAYGAEIIKQLASAKPEEIDEAKEEFQKIYDQMKDICKSYREEKEKQIEEAYQDYLKKKAEAEQAESERQAARGEDKSSRLDLSQFVSEE